MVVDHFDYAMTLEGAKADREQLIDEGGSVWWDGERATVCTEFDFCER